MPNLQELFDFAIEIGVKNDPRGKKEISEILKRTAKEYKNLDKQKKEFFNQERLRHPFADSNILVGKPQQKIKKIMVGVDIETPELLLAAELNRQGAKIDAVMAHHPEGRSLLDLSGVMRLQEDIFEQIGVSANVAEKILAPRLGEINRGVHATNALRPLQAAELLGLAYFNVHTPADNCAYQYMEKNICSKKMRTLGEVLEAITKIPEFLEAARYGNEPAIILGDKNSKPGKVVATGFTGGTSGSKKIYAKLAQAGVGTILSMHMSDEYRKEAEKHNLNVIVCSHMAADSLGMNPILDAYEKKGVEVVPVSGLIRIKR